MIQNDIKIENELTSEEERILNTIEKWMDHNIETMIRGKCNVACATLLGIYMEILGGISSGRLSEYRQDEGFTKANNNFKQFLELLPREYRTLDNELYRDYDIGLYQIFRSTLVHAYFFGNLDINTNSDQPLSRCCPEKIGIRKSEISENRFELHTNDLADDIKKARDRLFQMIRENEGDYRKNFKNALKNIQNNPIFQSKKSSQESYDNTSEEVNTTSSGVYPPK